MRLCRFRHQGRDLIGFYDESSVVPLNAQTLQAVGQNETARALLETTDLLDLLPPTGKHFSTAQSVAKRVADLPADARQKISVAGDHVEFLVPIPRPNKLFLLAGNYGDHIQEGGGIAPERAETFPYVFMKPPSTTLIAAGKPIVIPKASPAHVDWELELAVVIGRRGKHITAAQAKDYIAGYTVINDVSDRQYRPNPSRKPREKDSFFDWQHGKWHDSFCPCGPCITTADAIPDPQKLAMKLSVNGTVRQNGSTGQQIFPVFAVIEFLSQSCTLEPGDIISTGTPAGVGHSSKTYLKAGDRVDAWIESIGTLTNPVTAE
ncbi:MAG TPA: fumarylacetoacetate hydrolase family protein [Planctomycetaceae bacterium]|nr:fumarylacetoacetate hydrolase family protein [Planctomycetaceae bacterium]